MPKLTDKRLASLIEDLNALGLAERPTIIECRTGLIELQLARAVLQQFADVYAKHSDPGVSDLDNEQPVSWHAPLGAYRMASMLVR